MSACDSVECTRKARNVLLVEDLEELRELIGLLLEEQGWTVWMAQDGHEACAILAKETVHLIVSDYQMPKMDGASLLKHCRTTGLTMPFVLMTGNPGLCDSLSPYQPDAIAAKPLDADSFLAITSNYVIK